MQVDMQIEGLEELAKNVNKLNTSFQRTTIRTALRAGARAVLKRAKTNVPVQSRNLKRSLGSRVKVLPRGFGFADIGARQGGGRSGSGYHLHLVEFGTKVWEGNPFLEKSFDEAEQAGEIHGAFIESLNKTIAAKLGKP